MELRVSYIFGTFGGFEFLIKNSNPPIRIRFIIDYLLFAYLFKYLYRKIKIQFHSFRNAFLVILYQHTFDRCKNDFLFRHDTKFGRSKTTIGLIYLPVSTVIGQFHRVISTTATMKPSILTKFFLLVVQIRPNVRSFSFASLSCFVPR